MMVLVSSCEYATTQLSRTRDQFPRHGDVLMKGQQLRQDATANLRSSATISSGDFFGRFLRIVV